jgi:hypothetical protein
MGNAANNYGFGGGEWFTFQIHSNKYWHAYAIGSGSSGSFNEVMRISKVLVVCWKSAHKTVLSAENSLSNLLMECHFLNLKPAPDFNRWTYSRARFTKWNSGRDRRYWDILHKLYTYPFI